MRRGEENKERRRSKAGRGVHHGGADPDADEHGHGGPGVGQRGCSHGRGPKAPLLGKRVSGPHTDVAEKKKAC